MIVPRVVDPVAAVEDAVAGPADDVTLLPAETTNRMPDVRTIFLRRTRECRRPRPFFSEKTQPMALFRRRCFG